MKVDLGAGKRRSAGWVTCDADPRLRCDVTAKIPPVPEQFEGAKVFRLLHVLEHLYLWEARRVLAECFRLLAPGGLIVIEVPNLESAVETLASSTDRDRDRWGMWVLYGNPTAQNRMMAHRWAWTPDALEAEAQAVGFQTSLEKARTHVPDRDFRLVGMKP